jgi:hypothetical protein
MVHTDIQALRVDQESAEWETYGQPLGRMGHTFTRQNLRRGQTMIMEREKGLAGRYKRSILWKTRFHNLNKPPRSHQIISDEQEIIDISQ